MRSILSYRKWSKYLVCLVPFLLSPPVHSYALSGPQFRGPEVNVEGTLGVRCGSRAGDSPGVYMQGGVLNGNEPTAMIGVMIPFHPDKGDCSTILSYEEAMSRLLIAESLLERGLMSPEEYKTIADEVKAILED